MEGAEGEVYGVVHSGMSHGPEEVVGVEEAYGVPGHYGGVDEGLTRKLLPTPVGSTSWTCQAAKAER